MNQSQVLKDGQIVEYSTYHANSKRNVEYLRAQRLVVDVHWTSCDRDLFGDRVWLVCDAWAS
jgi:hypothetical protein